MKCTSHACELLLTLFFEGLPSVQTSVLEASSTSVVAGDVFSLKLTAEDSFGNPIPYQDGQFILFPDAFQLGCIPSKDGPSVLYSCVVGAAELYR